MGQDLDRKLVAIMHEFLRLHARAYACWCASEYDTTGR